MGYSIREGDRVRVGYVTVCGAEREGTYEAVLSDDRTGRVALRAVDGAEAGGVTLTPEGAVVTREDGPAVSGSTVGVLRSLARA
jgi:hypothetical protein